MNTCLLGASCYEEGLALAAPNPRDFELIREVEDFEVQALRPS